MIRKKYNKLKHYSKYPDISEPVIKFKHDLYGKNGSVFLEKHLYALSILHFATFLLSEFYSRTKKSKDNIFYIRSQIELIFEKENYEFSTDCLAKFSSFIDQYLKELNLTPKPIFQLCIKQAVDTRAVYIAFHGKSKLIFEITQCWDINSQTKMLLENCYEKLKITNPELF